MAYEMKEKSFQLWVNTDKTNPEAPDFSGSIMFSGKEWGIAIWKKTASNGKTYYSGKLGDPPKKSNVSANPVAPAKVITVIDDDVPF